MAVNTLYNYRYLLFLSLLGVNVSVAGPSEDGRKLGESLQEKQKSSLQDKALEKNLQEASRFSGEKKHSKESAMNQKLLNEMQNRFTEYNDLGSKDKDPLKVDLGKFCSQKLESSSETEPSLTEASELLKQKHRWHIEEDSSLLQAGKASKNENTSSSEKDEKISKSSEKDEKNYSEKTFTCRESAPLVEKKCTRFLVVKSKSKEPIVKTVNARVSANMHPHTVTTFKIDLKNGGITLSNTHLPVDFIQPSKSFSNPIGNLEDYTQVKVELQSQKTDGSYVNFNFTAPDVSNGFVATLTATPPGGGYYKLFTLLGTATASYTWKVTLTELPTLEKHWEGCELEEKYVKENYCQLASSEKRGIDEKREVKGYPSLVKEDFWSEDRTYLCGLGSEARGCERFKQAGCEQTDSRCVQGDEKACVEYEQTYRCDLGSYSQGNGLSMEDGKVIYDPKKMVPDLEETFGTEDFGEAVTEFSALMEMGRQMKDGLGGISQSENPSVFRGECRRCSVKLGSFFQDCCNMKGLALGLLGGCRDGEKKLAVAAVKDKRCHQVQGKYCATKVLKVCVEKKEAYCCFGSQIAKIIQEIAHQQLNISWGTGEDPNCESLTASQLSQLDFDTSFAREKLSALLTDIQALAQEKTKQVQGKVSGKTNISERLESLQKRMKQHFSQDKSKSKDNVSSEEEEKI